MMEGDVVIVRRQDDVDSGDVAIVLVNGDEATVKRIKNQPEGIYSHCHQHQRVRTPFLLQQRNRRPSSPYPRQSR